MIVMPLKDRKSVFLTESYSESCLVMLLLLSCYNKVRTNDSRERLLCRNRPNLAKGRGPETSSAKALYN